MISVSLPSPEFRKRKAFPINTLLNSWVNHSVLRLLIGLTVAAFIDS
jgi:hypothetical protein